MYRYLILLLISGSAYSHEFTPTYPELKYSHVQGVLKVDMELFNRREDVSYYELEVLDKSSVPLPFATQSKIVSVSFLERKKIEIYIREIDAGRAVYVCSKSKLNKGMEKASAVASKICSKIKR